MNRKIRSSLVLPALVLFLGACASPTKYYEQGKYDQAIMRSLEQMRKGRATAEDIQTLSRAFQQLNTPAIARLELLLQSPHASRWDEIADLTQQIDQRQNLIKPYLPLYLPNSGQQAEVISTKQFKSARIEALIEISELASGRVVTRMPAAAESVFRNDAIWWRGDERALSAKTRRTLHGQPCSYPSSDQMLAYASELLAAEVRRTIRGSRTMFVKD